MTPCSGADIPGLVFPLVSSLVPRALLLKLDVPDCEAPFRLLIGVLASGRRLIMIELILDVSVLLRLSKMLLLLV